MSLLPESYAPGAAGHLAHSGRIAKELNVVIDVRADLGALGDGTGNDATVLNTSYAAAAAGTVYYYSKGSYRVTTALAWTGKALHHIFAPGAKLVEGTALATPVLTGTDADGSIIDGIAIEGADTEGNFVGAASDKVGVRLSSTVGAKIIHPVITGKQYGVELLNCDECVVDKPRITGFAATAIADVNHHQGVRVDGGTRNKVYGPEANNIGSAVVGTNETVGLRIMGGDCNDCWDNCIYIVSGHNCLVYGFSGDGGGEGGGIAMQGSRNQVIGNIVRNVDTGIRLSGIDVADALGAGGREVSCAYNIVTDAQLHGIALREYGVSDLYLRDVDVSHNVIARTGLGDTGSAAIFGTANRTSITHNTILDCRHAVANGGAILIVGILGDATVDRLVGMDISHNKILGTDLHAISLYRLKDSVIHDNSADPDDLPGASARFMWLENVIDSSIKDNVCRGKDIRLDADCVDNEVQGNDCTLVTAADTTLNWIVHRGSGAPAVRAKAGSQWHRTDGGAGTCLYVKESNTAAANWVAK